MPLNTLDRINAMPEFQKFTYRQQVEVRYRMLGPKLMEDPKFQVMNTAAKKKVMDILVFTPPAFENPDVQKQVNNLYKMFKSGDPKARGQAQSTIASYEFNEGFSVFKAAENIS